MRECEARSNPISKKYRGNRLEKLLRECEARSNPVSKIYRGNRLEKLLRECNVTIMGKLVYIKQENNIIIG